MKDATEEGAKKEEEEHGAEVAPLTATEISVEEVHDSPQDTPVEVLLGHDVTGNASPTGDSSESTAVDGSTGSSKRGKSVNRKPAADAEAQKTNGQGLAGKINVLIAADVEAVLEGEFLRYQGSI